MSIVQSPVAPEQRGPFGAEPARSPLDLRLILGLGLVGLGIGMLCLGVFHGFAHGSCSSTGLFPQLRAGAALQQGHRLVDADADGGAGRGGGRSGSGPLGRLAACVPLVFVAIGAPFVALALGNHGQLLLNASSSSGKIFAGVFGGCFVVAGLIWGAVRRAWHHRRQRRLAARRGAGGARRRRRPRSRSRPASPSAIGKTTAPSSVQVAPGVTVLSPAAERAREISLARTCRGSAPAQRA